MTTTTTPTPTSPPARMPKTADYGDCRYYEWVCPRCGIGWTGSYDRTIVDTGGCEPYTLLYDGQACGQYSYLTAADMHDDWRAAAAEHLRGCIGTQRVPHHR